MCREKDPAINISETLQPEYDIKMLIQQLEDLASRKIIYMWIKGHQDEIHNGTKIYGPCHDK